MAAFAWWPKARCPFAGTLQSLKTRSTSTWRVVVECDLPAAFDVETSLEAGSREQKRVKGQSRRVSSVKGEID